MADLSITAANVLKGSDAQTWDGTSGAAFTAGQTGYLDTNTNTIKLADANASAATATVKGIALHACASGQPLKLQTKGEITIGATLVQGQVYVQSATAGGIAPVADLASGWRTSVIGIAKTTAILTVGITNSGITV